MKATVWDGQSIPIQEGLRSFDHRSESRRPQSMNLHFDQGLAIVLISPEAKGDIPGWRRKRIRRSPEITRAPMDISLAKTQKQMLVLHDPDRSSRFNFARKKKRLRIGIAERLKHFVPVKKFEIDIRKCQLVIEAQPRLQFVVRQHITGDSAKSLQRKHPLFLPESQGRQPSHGRRISPGIGAPAERLHQMKTRNAAAASFAKTAIIKSNHDCRTMIFVGQSRCHDAEHAGMPTAGSRLRLQRRGLDRIPSRSVLPQQPAFVSRLPASPDFVCPGPRPGCSFRVIFRK